MRKRHIHLPRSRSFFLFGARNTGKSTLIRQQFDAASTFCIDLLHADTENHYRLHPEYLREEVMALDDDITHVFIDEIQKVPALLDEVHALIESTSLSFILTGSSARKLKRGAANLLAGRAFVKHLFPFTVFEVGSDFCLDNALNWGMLPEIFGFEHSTDKADFLRAYANTYLREEIWLEHIVRKLAPFQYFLEVAAQCNGTTINISKIARDIGVGDNTVSEYFNILQDTLVGFMLPAFNHSFRKRLIQKPKFYYFDCGILKALKKTLSIQTMPGTYEYGKSFEHFLITEILKCASYFYPDYQFSYLRTRHGLEVDLVVERPGEPLLMIEIKSTPNVQAQHLKHLKDMQHDFPDPIECICLAPCNQTRNHEGILILPWQKGLQQYFLPKEVI